MEAHANPEEFDLYALGALEGEDRQRFEAHLRSCEPCRKQLAEAQTVCALIGMSAPAVEPPPSAKARLMDNIKNEKTTNEQHAAQGNRQPGRKRARWGLRFSLGFALTTIALAVLCAWLWQANAQHEQQISKVTNQLQQAQAQSQQDQAQMQAMTKVMGAPDTIQVSLAHQTGTPPGSGQVFYNSRMGIAVYTGEIATPPSNKSYQLWLVPESGSPVNAGIVQANQGEGASVAHVPQGLSAKAFAVTLEPQGGKPQPTGPKVLLGAVSSST